MFWSDEAFAALSPMRFCLVGLVPLAPVFFLRQAYAKPGEIKTGHCEFSLDPTEVEPRSGSVPLIGTGTVRPDFGLRAFRRMRLFSS
ncbi:hypothetical protein ACVW0I_006776 [Bradyrhizobium sp. LM6.11]